MLYTMLTEVPYTWVRLKLIYYTRQGIIFVMFPVNLTIFESKLHQVIVILQLSCRTFGDAQGDGGDPSINDVQFAGF